MSWYNPKTWTFLGMFSSTRRNRNTRRNSHAASASSVRTASRSGPPSGGARTREEVFEAGDEGYFPRRQRNPSQSEFSEIMLFIFATRARIKDEASQYSVVDISRMENMECLFSFDELAAEVDKDNPFVYIPGERAIYKLEELLTHIKTNGKISPFTRRDISKIKLFTGVEEFEKDMQTKGRVLAAV